MARAMGVNPALPVQRALGDVAPRRTLCISPSTDSAAVPALSWQPFRLVRVSRPAGAGPEAMSITELLKAAASELIAVGDGRPRGVRPRRRPQPPPLQQSPPPLRRYATARLPPVKRVLVANRGEIALRVIRACHEEGLEAVAVCSTADRAAPHVRAADHAVEIGPPPPAESYLRIDRLIAAALDSGADAVHPGYGFLAERADVRRGGRARRTSSSSARPPPPFAPWATRPRRVAACATPACRWCPARTSRSTEPGAAQTLAKELGYPVLVKAAAGGGGKGMRVVRDAGGAGARAGDRRLGGAQGVRRRQRLPGEVDRAAAPRRDPGAGRPRAHRAPGRARVLDPAPASEAGRRGPISRGHARAPRVDGLGGGRGGAGGGLPRRGNLRVSAGAGPVVLLPRDEHPDPGRAPRHRAGLRRGSGAGAAPHRRGRAHAGARPLAGAARLVDGVPDHQRGSGQRLPAFHRPHRAPAGAWRSRRALGRRSRDRRRGHAVLRLTARQAHRVGAAPGGRPSTGWRGRSTSW